MAAGNGLTLGDVLTERRERVLVSAEREYPIAGVYGFGRGVLLRDPVKGADISATSLYRITSDQIIYSRLKAFEGAFALVPPSADGRFVSNEFPTFDVDERWALPAFVALVLSRPSVWRQLTARITGVGARRERLQVADFLEFELELPDLAEQRRIVDAVDTARHASRLARAEAEAASSLAGALLRELAEDPDVHVATLGDVAQLDLDLVRVREDQRYRVAGVAIAGNGLFWRETIEGSGTKYQRLHRLRPNQLVYRKLTAWEGPITVVPAEFDGAVVSPEFPTLTLDVSQLVPGFMAFLCRQPSFHQEMRSRSTGTAERRNRLKPTDLLEIEIALPPCTEQQRVAAAAELATSLTKEAEASDVIAAALREELLADV